MPPNDPNFLIKLITLIVIFPIFGFDISSLLKYIRWSLSTHLHAIPLKRLLTLHSLLNVKQTCLSPIKLDNWRMVLKILCHIRLGERSNLCHQLLHQSLYFVEFYEQCLYVN